MRELTLSEVGFVAGGKSAAADEEAGTLKKPTRGELALCYLYGVSRSLYPCMIAHAIFNLAAYITSNYMVFHKVRTEFQLESVYFWIPHVWMLIISTIVLVVVINKWWPAIRVANLIPREAASSQVGRFKHPLKFRGKG